MQQQSFTEISQKALPEVFTRLLPLKIVPLIRSSPGMGKSAIIAQYAAKHNLCLIDVRLSQCDVCDLQGFPHFNLESKTASYYPMDMFPTTGRELPLNASGKPYVGWLLFLDELTSVDGALQKASYKLILDRMVGGHHLHEKVYVVAAGNLETDNALVEPMSTALMSRLAHFYVRLDVTEWKEWAYSKNIDYRILAYINWKPAALYTFDPEYTFDTYACPRTWEFASKVINGRELTGIDSAILQGVLGKTVGIEFDAFTRIYQMLPDISKIHENPLTAPLMPSDRLDMQYALVSKLAHEMTAENVTTTLQYVSRLSVELQAVTIKLAHSGKSQKDLAAIVSSPSMRTMLSSVVKQAYA